MRFKVKACGLRLEALVFQELLENLTRKVDVRLPGKDHSNSHGAWPVHLIIMTIKWIWTSGLAIKYSLTGEPAPLEQPHLPHEVIQARGCVWQ